MIYAEVSSDPRYFEVLCKNATSMAAWR